ncbi:hypothetical protein PtA15_4A875 [Puccinia triticina]|uniref:Uncharacterized protein n=1 Tax=Puccinia triticina TaxID=208348 RepID=A0ABY7CKC1_9BASI|nr:uncharacterized protein PtA15_4A875 [Puccinia triticina]WAQ84422.1 hypothetical protein PtA15_4A875 [Puccinia triticina]WAR55253.1 hypothetical protein PtB15_4B873 [Puccinia triticina]
MLFLLILVSALPGLRATEATIWNTPSHIPEDLVNMPDPTDPADLKWFSEIKRKHPYLTCSHKPLKIKRTSKEVLSNGLGRKFKAFMGNIMSNIPPGYGNLKLQRVLPLHQIYNFCPQSNGFSVEHDSNTLLKLEGASFNTEQPAWTASVPKDGGVESVEIAVRKKSSDRPEMIKFVLGRTYPINDAANWQRFQLLAYKLRTEKEKTVVHKQEKKEPADNQGKKEGSHKPVNPTKYL